MALAKGGTGLCCVCWGRHVPDPARQLAGSAGPPAARVRRRRWQRSGQQQQASKQASRSGGRWARGVDRIHKALHLRQPITRESLRMLGGRLAADQRPSAAVADVVVCGCVQARRVRLQAVSKEGLEVRTSGRCGVCVCGVDSPWRAPPSRLSKPVGRPSIDSRLTHFPFRTRSKQTSARRAGLSFSFASSVRWTATPRHGRACRGRASLAGQSA